MSGITLRAANLADPADCQLLMQLTDAYARDAMGGGEGLSAQARQHLPAALGRHPGLFALIAERDGEAVGHALCVLGFSSFYAAPVCNLHDLSVLPAARGLGLGKALLQPDDPDILAVATDAALPALAVRLLVHEHVEQNAIEPAAHAAPAWHR